MVVLVKLKTVEEQRGRIGNTLAQYTDDSGSILAQEIN
jgi:hypothetical protein